MMALHSETPLRLVALLSAGLVAATALSERSDVASTAFDLPPMTALDAPSETPRIETRLVSRVEGVAHAPSLIAHGDGTLQTVWYQGTREAGADVGLYTARFRGGEWSAPEKITDGEAERRDSGRFVHTIGNPALMRHANGEIWLFYVATPLGWSAARIALRRSADGGRTWSAPKFLHATPFFNISMLVRSPPSMTTNGLVALPAYFEFDLEYPVLLFLDANGDIVGRQSMNPGGTRGIQPFVVPRQDGSAIAFLRPTGGMSRHIYVTQKSSDGGQWSRAVPTSVPNPRTPVCGVRFADGSVVVVHNVGGNEWHRLGFLFSPDEGRTWLSLPHRIEGESGSRPIGYCTLRAGAGGGIEMVYSDKQRGRIHHMSANRAWLIRQIESGTRTDL